MGWQDNFYSWLVASMKIILPLVALGLLSTLFLISRTVDPTRSAPVARIDLEQRAHDLGATNPSFAGVTDRGDEVTFRAGRAKPDPNDPERLLADTVSAEMRLASGTVVGITADRADMHQREYTAILDGSVSVQSSMGYRLHTETLRARTDRLHARTDGPVTGTGPPGTLTAGRMLLTFDDEAGAAQLIFTDGVKLVYSPKTSRD